MRQYLLPVWGWSRYATARKDAALRLGAWWSDEPFDYPHALISYVHWKQRFEFPEDAYIFGDSGGFSLGSKRATKLDPVDVLHWQAHLCTVGCVLDLPPSRTEWQLPLEVTADHTRRALPWYEKLRAGGTPFRWWGVLHGDHEYDVREYFHAISDIYPFTDSGEGWAVKAEPEVNPFSVARSLRILRTLNISRAHFLKATSQSVIATLLALGVEAGLDLLTYDSAYALKSGLNRAVFVPTENGLTYRILREREEGSDARDYLRDRCSCRVCEFMRSRSDELTAGRYENRAGVFGGWFSSWSAFHNAEIQRARTAALAAAAERDPAYLLREVLGAKACATVRAVFEREGHEPNPGCPRGRRRGLLSLV